MKFLCHLQICLRKFNIKCSDSEDRGIFYDVPKLSQLELEVLYYF